ncbi:MAG TPA: hypothetical protein VII43_04315 [Opitutaceae bacterium]
MPNRAPKLLLAFLAAASLAAAQDAAPAPAPDAPPTRDAPAIVLAAKPGDSAPVPVPDRDPGARSVSPGVAQALADGMPRYHPPTPVPTQTAEQVQAQIEADKPKNAIPRLPAYIVRESRPPVFRNRELLTDAGIVGLTFRRHPGLAIGNIFGLNEGVAKQMFYDDERLDSMEDLADTAHAMAQGGDRAEAQYILQESKNTFMRIPDTTWGGPGGGGGFSATGDFTGNGGPSGGGGK